VGAAAVAGVVVVVVVVVAAVAVVVVVVPLAATEVRRFVASTALQVGRERALTRMEQRQNVASDSQHNVLPREA